MLKVLEFAKKIENYAACNCTFTPCFKLVTYFLPIWASPFFMFAPWINPHSIDGVELNARQATPMASKNHLVRSVQKPRGGKEQTVRQSTLPPK